MHSIDARVATDPGERGSFMTLAQASISVILSLAIALIIAGPLAKSLRNHAWAYYAVFTAVTALYLWYHFSGTYIPGLQMILGMFQKGYLSCWLLAIVMFTGCFDMQSPIRHHLQPIRAELSILSFIVMNAHAWYYLPIYLPNFVGYVTRDAWLGSSLVVSIILTVLYVPLTVTSIKAIRAAMSSKKWKSLQRWAYVLVALLYLHIIFVLARPLVFGGTVSGGTMVSLVVYGVIGVAYVALRLAKFARDRKVAQAAEAAA